MYDLATFATEVDENQLVDDVLEDMSNHYLIEPFPSGDLKRDVSALIGRSAFECLVNHEFRDKAIQALAAIHYKMIEGE